MTERQNGARPKEITVLVAEPDRLPGVRRIVPETDAMKKIVGGSVQETCPFAAPVAVVYNGNGEELRLPGRYLLRNGSGQPYAVIHGTFLAVGVSNGTYVSLTGAQIMWLLALFHRDRLSAMETMERTVSGMKHRRQSAPFPVGSQSEFL